MSSSEVVVVRQFSSIDRTSAAFIALGGIVSIISITLFASRIAYVAVRPWFREGVSADNSKESAFFRTQLGAYAACLLFANLLSNAAGVIDISWSNQGMIKLDSQCKTQAALLQIGDVAAAYFTGAMAVHAFNSLVLMRGVVLWVTTLIIAVGWFVAILLGTAVQTLQRDEFGPFFAPVELYCWISNSYPAAQFGLRYLFIILVSGLSVIIYAVIFLCLRGTLVLNNGLKVRLGEDNPRCTMEDFVGTAGYCNFLRTVVSVMLWFPLAYVVLYLPLVISRLTEISGSDVPSTAFGFSATVAQLLGLANVIILYNILKVLGPAFNTPRADPALESFSTPEPPKPVMQPQQVEIPPPVIQKPARAFPPPVSRTQPSLGSYRFPPSTTSLAQASGTNAPSLASSSPPSGLPSNPRASPHNLPPKHRHHRSDDTTISYSSNRSLLHKASNGEFGYHSRSSSEASSATTATATSIGRYGSPLDAFKPNFSPRSEPVSSTNSASASPHANPGSGRSFHQRSPSDPSLNSASPTPNRFRTTSPLRRQLSLMSIVDGQPSTGTAISPIVEDLGVPNPPFARFASRSTEDLRLQHHRQDSHGSVSSMRTPTPIASPTVSQSALVVGDSRYPAFSRSSPVVEYSQQRSAPPTVEQRQRVVSDLLSARPDSYYDRRSTSDSGSEPYSAISGPRLSEVQFEVAHFTAFPPGAHLTPGTIISSRTAGNFGGYSPESDARQRSPASTSPAVGTSPLANYVQSGHTPQSGLNTQQGGARVENYRRTVYSEAELPSPYDQRTLPDFPEEASVQRNDTVSTNLSQAETEQRTPASLPQRSDSLESHGQEVQFTLYRHSQESEEDEIILQPSSAFSNFSVDIQRREPRSDLPRTPSVEIRQVSANLDASHLVVLQKQRAYNVPRSPTVSLPVSVQSPSAESLWTDLQRNHSVIDMYMPQTPTAQLVLTTTPSQAARHTSEFNKSHSVIDLYLPRSPGTAEIGLQPHSPSPTGSYPSQHSTDSFIDSYSDPSPLADAFPQPPTTIVRNESLIDLYARRATRLETLHEVESEQMSPIAESEDGNRESLIGLYKRRTEVPDEKPTVTIDTTVPLPDGFKDLARSPAPIAPFVLSPAESHRSSKGFGDPSPELFDAKKRTAQKPRDQDQSTDDPVTWATLVARAATGDEFVVRPFSLFQSEFVNSYNDRHVSQLPSSLRAGAASTPPVPPLPNTIPASANSEGSRTPSPKSSVDASTPKRAAPMYGYI